MVIMIAGAIRLGLIHIQLGFCECHEAVYAVVNQVALWGSASHYMAADRRPLPLSIKAGLNKNTQCNWEVQLLPL